MAPSVVEVALTAFQVLADFEASVLSVVEMAPPLVEIAPPYFSVSVVATLSSAYSQRVAPLCLCWFLRLAHRSLCLLIAATVSLGHMVLSVASIGLCWLLRLAGRSQLVATSGLFSFCSIDYFENAT